jgi:hypothetical protein
MDNAPVLVVLGRVPQVAKAHPSHNAPTCPHVVRPVVLVWVASHNAPFAVVRPVVRPVALVASHNAPFAVAVVRPVVLVWLALVASNNAPFAVVRPAVVLVWLALVASNNAPFAVVRPVVLVWVALVLVVVNCAGVGDGVRYDGRYELCCW